MNNEIKNKINTIGKVGRVITIIAKVIAIVGIVGLCLAGTVGLIMPKDTVKFSMGGDAQVKVSGKFFEGSLPLLVGVDDWENGSFSVVIILSFPKCQTIIFFLKEKQENSS